VNFGRNDLILMLGHNLWV